MAALTAIDLAAVARTVGGLVKTSIAHQQWAAKLKQKVTVEVWQQRRRTSRRS